jgi:endonuclease-8
VPEGDIVWFTARRLHEALAGRRLTVSDFRVPRWATTDLRGRQVRETVSRGKHLLTRVDGDVTVHTHLKMDGSWRIRRPAHADHAARTHLPRDHRVRLVLGNAEWLAVGYLLGIVEVLRTAREDRVVGHLGPDLLGPGWDPAEAVRRLRARPETTIGEALLDQTRLAGIGTIYRAEVLFLRGVHPRTPVAEVADLTALVSLAQRLLAANKEGFGQVTTGDRRRGREQYVYGRAGRPCRRCGTRVERATLGADPYDRVVYWCPSCQPAPPGARLRDSPGPLP